MTETPEMPQNGQPGMRRRKERVQRPVTTVIDGKPSTRMETQEVWVDVPPRDWDEIIRRGATSVAVLVTLLAAAGTTASVGGLLGRLLHPGVAYAVGAVFTSSWLVCLGIEHIERVDADRAARARNAGWIMLLIGMAAVITYGHEMEQLPAGVVGSCLDLAAKGLWWLIMGLDRVKLDAGVAHWVTEQEQEMAGRYLLGIRLRRLNRRAVQLHAGGPEFQAAQAIMSQATGQPQQLPAADMSGHAVPVSAPVSGQTPAQAPMPVSGQVPDPSGPPPSAPTPPPAAPTPPPSAPTVPPAAPVPPPAAPAPPVPPVTPAATGASGSSEQGGEEEQPEEQGTTGTPPNLQPVGPLSIAAAVRQARTEDPDQTDAQMVARVLMLRGGDDNGDRVKFTDTVLRTRRRQENPPARRKKTRSA
ncbi:hypothetical protein [Streptomyces sp. SAI-127]|uniref:hypothetical protein n=1 Tax=Streptomyces sp. SAI-127 TaxID=2940543 RepID=UPI002475D473|nr:hypothetical protein [Streptomyces sp. SAI-127]MDH6489614.1 hypothetical protein [Streptomyces sp. SAI-127]